MICWRELNPFKVPRGGEILCLLKAQLWFIICNNCTNESIWCPDNDTIFYSRLIGRKMIYDCAHISHMWFFIFPASDTMRPFPIRSTLPFCYCVVCQWKEGKKTERTQSHNFSCFKFLHCTYCEIYMKSTKAKSWKSCNFPQSSIILSHQNEGERNSSYCFL